MNYISAPTFITIADDELKYRAVAERSARVSPRKKLQITIGVTRSRKNYDYLTKSPAESYPVAAARRPKKVEITKKKEGKTEEAISHSKPGKQPSIYPSIHPAIQRADPKQLRNYVYYDARCDDGSAVE